MNYLDFLNLQAKNDLELSTLRSKNEKEMKRGFLVLAGICLTFLIWLAYIYFS